MAFLIDCVMYGYEVRGVTSGTSKKGNAFRSIRVESQDGRTAEISCTDSQLFAGVDALKKAENYDFTVRAVAGRERSYLSLLAVPTVSGIHYES